MSKLTISEHFNEITLSKLPTEAREKIEGTKVEIVPLTGSRRIKQANTTLFR